MSEFKGTPGRWEVSGKTSIESDLGGFICEAYGDSCSWEQDQANASLIAAAPELLEALQDMLSGWQHIRQTHGDLYGVGWDRAEQKAAGAIAKALGQQPLQERE